MRICGDHWKHLREAIDQRGLAHLIAKSGKEAIEQIQRQFEGDKSDFDPLMSANWAISAAYLQGAGLNGMIGDKCPLCEVEKQKIGLADNWISGCADDQLVQARVRGLVAREQ